MNKALVKLRNFLASLFHSLLEHKGGVIRLIWVALAVVLAILKYLVDGIVAYSHEEPLFFVRQSSLVIPWNVLFQFWNRQVVEFGRDDMLELLDKGTKRLMIVLLIWLKIYFWPSSV